MLGSGYVEIDLAAAQALDDAVGVMNNGGEHWTVGTMCELIEDRSTTGTTAFNIDPKKCRYCSVGGLRVAIFGGPESPPNFPFGSLFTEEEKRQNKVYTTALCALVLSTPWKEKITRHGDYDHLEGLVIDWNDSMETAHFNRADMWNEVSSAFKQGAAALRAQWTD